jgi:Tfp pilus assembly protein PilW
MSKQIIKNQSGGYTIIETMIAVSLFVLIVTLGMGALLNANVLHKKSENMRSILDNLSFIMEDISRSLRTGYNYHCLIPNQAALPDPFVGRDCVGGLVGIAFEAENGDPNVNADQWVYYIQAGRIYKISNGEAAVALTPVEVVVEQFSFTVDGSLPPPGNTEQPFVTIKIVGNITEKGVVTPFALQTAVSQRALDI